jgi:Fur family ferric uptake transcriptional regulator
MITSTDARLALDKFRQFLAREGLSWTRPRRTIADLALKAKDHFTAQELTEWARRRDASIGRVTVYRTLSLLVASGLVAERDFLRDRKHYEPIAGRPHHEHMICIECKRIIEFINDEIERLQEVVAREHGFEIVHHIHKLFGYCARCRKAKGRTR